ncbi:Fic family protein [Candidatus Saccharibacteria bacterium]|nr:Fic family protein [Candidatus Saccharibacteria bacterium]
MDKYKIQPAFDSKLTSMLFEMESVRNKFLSGSTPPWLFFDLKDTLHLLESLSSARIEGNHTTLVAVINEATKTDDEKTQPEDTLLEIININKAIDYIETYLNEGDTITATFVRELHALTVDSLKRDGSRTPGRYRTGNVRIANSNCVVSSPQMIESDMLELIDYINAPHEKKEDIIKIACAHHRFVAIHPFDNGNGRTARLLTYAMLIKYGFLKKKKTLLNPSSFFCMDRKKYYTMLDEADNGTPDGIEKWCEYVASGIMEEVNRMFKLLDRDFAVKNIIIPSIKESFKDNHLNEKECQILLIAAEKDTIQASDVMSLFGATASDRIKCSRFLSRMVESSLLYHPPKTPRKYVPRFFNKSLLTYVMSAMDRNGLILTKEEI